MSNLQDGEYTRDDGADARTRANAGPGQVNNNPLREWICGRLKERAMWMHPDYVRDYPKCVKLLQTLPVTLKKTKILEAVATRIVRTAPNTCTFRPSPGRETIALRSISPSYASGIKCEFVMPALVAGIHVFLSSPGQSQTWMAGTSPARTIG